MVSVMGVVVPLCFMRRVPPRLSGRPELLQMHYVAVAAVASLDRSNCTDIPPPLVGGCRWMGSV